MDAYESDSPNVVKRVSFMFPKHVGERDSEEAKVLAILEALYPYSCASQEELILENDSLNAVTWVTQVRRGL